VDYIKKKELSGHGCLLFRANLFHSGRLPMEKEVKMDKKIAGFIKKARY